MIKVDSIIIKEFRGIRDLTLDFKGKNFAICGPNGFQRNTSKRRKLLKR